MKNSRISRIEIFRLVAPLTIVFYCCGTNSDLSEELSGNYFFRDEGVEMKQVISHSPGRKNIYGKVIDYNYNYDFIVVLQKPNFGDYSGMVAFELRDGEKKYPVNTMSEGQMSTKDADSILKNNPFYKKIFANRLNYWIIAHKKDSVYGPFNKPEYQKMREVLGVPEGLKLNEE